jgi:hypothetical protein
MPHAATYTQRLRDEDEGNVSRLTAICEEIVSDQNLEGDYDDLIPLAQALRTLRKSKTEAKTLTGNHVSVRDAIEKVAGLIRDRAPVGPALSRAR